MSAFEPRRTFWTLPSQQRRFLDAKGDRSDPFYVLWLCCVPAAVHAQRAGEPIIDMHLHAYAVGFAGNAPACSGDQKPLQPTIEPRSEFNPADLGACSNPLMSPASDADYLAQSDHLKRMVDAGFEKRIMFGSDQMIWPGVIETAVAAIDTANYLTKPQKRDILYNNAARFLRPTRDASVHPARP